MTSKTEKKYVDVIRLSSNAHQFVPCPRFSLADMAQHTALPGATSAQDTIAAEYQLNPRVERLKSTQRSLFLHVIAEPVRLHQWSPCWMLIIIMIPDPGIWNAVAPPYGSSRYDTLIALLLVHCSK